MLLVTLVAVVLAALVVLGLVVTGPVAESVGNAIGSATTAVTVWNIAKWPVMLAVVDADRRPALLRHAERASSRGSAGSASAPASRSSSGWSPRRCSGSTSRTSRSYDKTYGSLAGVIVFLLWLWITNLALLFGAELDAELERGRELQAGMPAEEEIQLPARDTSGDREEPQEVRGRRQARPRAAAHARGVGRPELIRAAPVRP